MNVLTPDEVKRRIVEHLGEAEVDVTDMTGTQDHYDVTVVSSAFGGKTLIQQHKMVYDALGGAVGAEVHALKLTTRVPN
jgi:stress-induced morphogen